MTEIASPATFTGRPAGRVVSPGAKGEDAAVPEGVTPFALVDEAEEPAAADGAARPDDAAATGWVRFAAGELAAHGDDPEPDPTSDIASGAEPAAAQTPPVRAETLVRADRPLTVVSAAPAPPETPVPVRQADMAAPTPDRGSRADGAGIRTEPMTAQTTAPGAADRSPPVRGEPTPALSDTPKSSPRGTQAPAELHADRDLARARAAPSGGALDATPREAPAPVAGEAPTRGDSSAVAGAAGNRTDPVETTAAKPQGAPATAPQDADVALRAGAHVERGPRGREVDNPSPDRKAEAPQAPVRGAATAPPPPSPISRIEAGAARPVAPRPDPGAAPAGPVATDDISRRAEAAASRAPSDAAPRAETGAAPAVPVAAAVAQAIIQTRRLAGARTPSAAELGVRMAAAAAAGDGTVSAMSAASVDGGDLGGFGSGASAAPGGGAISVVVPVAHAGGAELARAVGDQLSVALSRRGRGVVELRLDPPELGKVRLTLGRGEHGVTASIVADRPDVADLLRRHADVLSQALTDAGQPRAELRFGAGSGSGGSGAGAGADGGGAQTGAGQPTDDAAPQTARTPQPRGPFGPRDGLDLRV